MSAPNTQPNTAARVVASPIFTSVIGGTILVTQSSWGCTPTSRSTSSGGDVEVINGVCLAVFVV